MPIQSPLLAYFPPVNTTIISTETYIDRCFDFGFASLSFIIACFLKSSLAKLTIAGFLVLTSAALTSIALTCSFKRLLMSLL